MMSIWGKKIDRNKERNTSKFTDPRNNWNESEGTEKHGMDEQGRTEKINTILGTERCINIVTL